MTYLQFHLMFIVPPLAVMIVTARALAARAWLGLLGMAGMALAYTAPWDAYLIRRGVWSYSPGRVVGTLAGVPLEEYLFFLLQTLLTGLWLLRLPDDTDADERAPAWPIVIACAVLFVAGLALLRWEGATYLGLILAWASPVLALQCGYDGRALARRRRALLIGVAVPTLYLWLADAIALHAGIWTISPRFTLGIRLGPLPLEEAIFFLVTNLLVVQGLMLFVRPGPVRA
jgi:lycopene beta-cyclase